VEPMQTYSVASARERLRISARMACAAIRSDTRLPRGMSRLARRMAFPVWPAGEGEPGMTEGVRRHLRTGGSPAALAASPGVRMGLSDQPARIRPLITARLVAIADSMTGR
jgi:hypothetical protein